MSRAGPVAAPFAIGYLILIQFTGDADFVNHGAAHTVTPRPAPS